MSDCTNCRDWRGCEKLDYFEYYEIVFCRNQILWIIVNRNILLSGEWPKRPEYIDKVQRSHSNEAPFERPEQIIAEVEARLEKTGRRGKAWCISEVQLYQNYEELSPGVKEIINYISGSKRRVKTYDQWKADKVWRVRKKSEIR